MPIKSEAEVVKRLGKGKLTIKEVHELAELELHEFRTLGQHEADFRAGRGEKPVRRSEDVLRVVSAMKLATVLAAVPGIGQAHSELILHEFDLDGDLRLDEIGSAEAFMLDSATRLVTHTRRRGKR